MSTLIEFCRDHSFVFPVERLRILYNINRLIFWVEVGSEIYEVLVGEQVVGAKNNPAEGQNTEKEKN